MPNFQHVITVDPHQMMIVVCIAELLFAIPFGLILKRLDLSPLWALLSFVPVVGIPALWLLAFIRWPRDALRESRSERSVSMMLSLAFLAPDIVEAAIMGTLPRGFGVTKLMNLPPLWHDQRVTLLR